MKIILTTIAVEIAMFAWLLLWVGLPPPAALAVLAVIVLILLAAFAWREWVQ